MAVPVCWFSGAALLICLQLASGNPNWNPPDFSRAKSFNEAKRSSGKISGMEGIGDDMYHDGIDLVLSRKQYMRLYKGQKERTDGHTIATPWKDGIIPYEIKANDFNDNQVQWIKRAMKHWEDVTCVRFRPAVPQDRNRVLIRTGQGCWSHLGMMGGTQICNLDPYCFWIGMIEHELGHTIGLIHEHQRPQRDAYIRVNYYGVQGKFVDALEKYAQNSDDKMGLDYDYTSVMHYSKTAFSSDGYTQTLFTRDPTKEDVIGMILGPSFTDAHLVNLMYNCAAKCTSPNKPTCQAGCFLTSDCQCFCQEDMPKEHCADVNETCVKLKDEGECLGNTFFMHTNCRKSCGICTEHGEIPHFPCLNGRDECDSWARRGDCQTNPGSMLRKCRLACGTCKVGDDHSVKGPCRDKNATCAVLADKGGCVRDPAHMLKDCTKSCDFCPEDVGIDPSEHAGPCSDYDAICYYWADNNLCQKYYAWMIGNCRKACGVCDLNIQLPDDCVDKNSHCHEWAFRGECDFNPPAMHRECKLSCNICDGISHPNKTCVDYNTNCPWWAEHHECYGNPKWMATFCPRSCHACPGDPPTSEPPCMDYNDHCAYWQQRGECEKNPTWMKRNCKVSCGVCKGGPTAGRLTTTPSGPCADTRDDCLGLAHRGDCQTHPGVMNRICAKTCGVCSEEATSQRCEDDSDACRQWAALGECDSNPSFMHGHCRKSCAKCGHAAPACQDDHTMCHDWAASNQCNLNPDYMLERCRLSCGVCP